MKNFNTYVNNNQNKMPITKEILYSYNNIWNTPSAYMSIMGSICDRIYWKNDWLNLKARVENVKKSDMISADLSTKTDKALSTINNMILATSNGYTTARAPYYNEFKTLFSQWDSEYAEWLVSNSSFSWFNLWNWNSGGRWVGYEDGNPAQIYCADVNGDGKSDLICRQNGGILYVSLSNGSGFNGWNWNSGGRIVGYDEDGSPAPIHFADVNGDGKSDLICKQNGGIIYVSLRNGSGFNGWSWNSGGRWVGYEDGSPAQIYCADVNGDGKSDLICKQNGGIIYVSLSNGSGFNGWSWNSGGRWVGYEDGSPAPIHFADVSGDGKSDLICKQNGGIIYVSLSNGSGFNGWSWNSGERWVGYEEGVPAQIYCADVNGDDKSDLICRQNGGIIYVSLSNGSGYNGWIWNSGGRIVGYDEDGSPAPIHFADVNGDGKSDLICKQNGGIIYASLSSK